METERHPTLEIIFTRTVWTASRQVKLRSALCRIASGSVIDHISVSNGKAVLSYTVFGKRYYPRDPFMSHYPGICAVWSTPTRHKIDLDRFGSTDPMNKMHAAMRYITMGRWYAKDCVTTAADILRSVEIDAPHTLVTPAGMLRYLKTLDIGVLDERDSDALSRLDR